MVSGASQPLAALLSQLPQPPSQTPSTQVPVEQLSAAANIFLGRERLKGGLIDTQWLRTESRRHLDAVGLKVDPDTRVSELSIGHQQLVEIARALVSQARLIVFDEPTSSLTRQYEALLATDGVKLKFTTDGIEAWHIGGHTPGSQATIVRGRERTLLFMGDLFMRPWQANPRWVTSYDDQAWISVDAKATIFAEAAREQWLVALSHEVNTPLGRIEREGERFRFVAEW